MEISEPMIGGGGMSGGFAAAQRTTPDRQLQVPDQLESQSRLLDELHHAITELEARTESVRVSRDLTEKQPGHPEPVFAPVAGVISMHNASIAGATVRLRSLLAELEV